MKGWDEKALLAHVMGEEGKQRLFERKLLSTVSVEAAVARALMQPTHRHVLQHRV